MLTQGLAGSDLGGERRLIMDQFGNDKSPSRNKCEMQLRVTSRNARELIVAGRLAVKAAGIKSEARK